MASWVAPVLPFLALKIRERHRGGGSSTITRVNFIIKVLVNAAALWVAARFVPGIDLTADIWQILLIALVFGLINTFLKPILKLLSLPVIILTLGLFAIIVNVILLAITAGLMDGLTIDGFLPALLGAIVISIVSAILNAIIPDPA